jgi:integrase
MAAHYLWCGLAQTTRKGYTTARNSYLDFCQLHWFSSPLPAKPLWLIEWMVSLAGRVKSRTLKLYLTGLKSYHIDLGLDTSAFEDERLERTIRGIKREHPDAPRRERTPLVRPKLLRILRVLSYPRYATSQEGITLRAAFTLAFAAFLRIGEITYSAHDLQALDFGRWFVTKRSVVIAKDGSALEISLPASKTDPFRKSVTITVAATGDAGCPVKAMSSYLSFDKRPPNAPLFVAPHNQPFSREYVVRRLRTLAQSAGLGSEALNGHSFRRGAATWAHAQGIPGETIQVLGRWSSSAYKLYIDLTQEERIKMSRQFQRADSEPA